MAELNENEIATAASGSKEYKMDKRWGAIAMIISATGMGLVGLLSRGATRIDLFDGSLGLAAGDSIGAFMAVGRMSLGVIFFVILLFVTKKVALFKKTKLSPAIALGGLMIGLSLACYVTSTLMTSIANAVFLIYTGPLFCTILARIFRKEPISIFQWICLAAVFAGMLLTSGIINFSAAGFSIGLDMSTSTPDFPQKGMGDMFGLASGVFYGLSMFFNGYRKDCDTTVRGVWNFMFAAAGAGVVTLILNSFWPLGLEGMQASNWGFAVVLWAVCGPLALGFLLVAGRNLPAVEYSTIAYWECVVALVIGIFVFQEALTIGTAVGGILIIVGGAAPVIQTMFEAGKKTRSETSSELNESSEKAEVINEIG